jgi:AraC-like DNA-binding protein
MHAIVAELFDGDLLEAFGEFVSRNTAHGLALSVEDRSHGVLGVLAMEAAWSDRRVAQLCGVSPKLVARLRRTTSPLRAVVEDKRIGRDGRARPVHPAAVRGRIVDALRDEPGASLRTIAQRVGVSPETVRRTRQRLMAASVHDATGTACDRGQPSRRIEPYAAPVDAPWRADAALRSTPGGVVFVEWFESTAVCTDRAPIEDVPLSRVYVVADEARRRAQFWADFADSLEQRTRTRPVR